MTALIEHIRACQDHPGKLADVLITEARCACTAMAKEISRLRDELEYAMATAGDLGQQFNREREKSRTAYFAAIEDVKARIDVPGLPPAVREALLERINGLKL